MDLVRLQISIWGVCNNFFCFFHCVRIITEIRRWFKKPRLLSCQPNFSKTAHHKSKDSWGATQSKSDQQPLCRRRPKYHRRTLGLWLWPFSCKKFVPSWKSTNGINAQRRPPGLDKTAFDRGLCVLKVGETFLGLLRGLCVSCFTSFSRDLYSLCRGFSTSFFLSLILSNKVAPIWPCLGYAGLLSTCTFAIDLWRTSSKATVRLYIFHMGKVTTAALPAVAIAERVLLRTIRPSILALSLGGLDFDTEWRFCSLDPFRSLGRFSRVGFCASKGKSPTAFISSIKAMQFFLPPPNHLQ